MFHDIFSAISRFFQQFVFWFILEPWEQALRVRLGKHIKTLKPGLHFRIPYVDSIHTDSSRYRTSLCAPQTLTTKDGKTVVCSVAVGYALEDIYKLYNTLYEPTNTITQTVAAFVADYVAGTDSTDLRAVELGQKITEHISEDFKRYGLKDVVVRMQDFAFIKAFRLINDQRYANYEGTTRAVGVPR